MCTVVEWLSIQAVTDYAANFFRIDGSGSIVGQPPGSLNTDDTSVINAIELFSQQSEPKLGNFCLCENVPTSHGRNSGRSPR